MTKISPFLILLIVTFTSSSKLSYLQNKELETSGISGIKPMIDLDILHLIEKFDPTPYQGKKLISEPIEFKEPIVYDITIKSAILTYLVPFTVIKHTEDVKTQKLKIVTDKVILHINAILDINVFKVFVKKDVDTKISIVISSVEVDLNFSGQSPVVVDIKVNIESIKIEFDNILDRVSKIISNIIENLVQKKVKEEIITLNKKLSDLTTKENIKEVDTHNVTVGTLKVNLTVLSKAQLVQNSKGKVYLQLGLNGRIFIDETAKDHDAGETPSEMIIDTKTSESIRLYLNDFVINSLLRVIQFKGLFKMTIDKDWATQNDFPISMDTVGLGNLIPELSEHYKVVNDCIIKLSIPNEQIIEYPFIISTDLKVAFFNKFYFQIDVGKRENDLNFLVDIKIMVDIEISKDLLSINYVGNSVSIIKYHSEIGEIDTSAFSEKLSSLISLVFDVSVDQFVNIDIKKLIKEKLPKIDAKFLLNSFYYDEKNGHNVLGASIIKKN